MKAKYFVSGHISITPEEFKRHYKDRLHDIVMNERDAWFIVGDAAGVDIMAQEYLIQYTGQVWVCHMFTTPRHNAGFNTLIGGFSSDVERDTYMTENSHTDIIWVRPGKERSGTAKNLARRHTAGNREYKLPW